nr:aspartyl-phosphate phosphatase Spo0E family protein [Sutcliffiella halmapala]
MNKCTIEKEIEQCRKKMIECASKHGLSASITVDCSQRLDKLLNLREQYKNINK